MTYSSRIIVVHPFKKFHLKRDRAHLEKLISAALVSSGAGADPKDKPRVSYYAVDPDDFRFGVKGGGTARFVKECQNLAKCVQGLLVSRGDSLPHVVYLEYWAYRFYRERIRCDQTKG